MTNLGFNLKFNLEFNLKFNLEFNIEDTFMVTIRLARGGAKKRPFYSVVVTDSRKPRDSGYIERLGYYNPRACGQETPLHLESDRIKHWMDLGAKPSGRVAKLIKDAAAKEASEAVA